MRRFMARVECTEAFDIPVEVDESMLDDWLSAMRLAGSHLLKMEADE